MITVVVSFIVGATFGVLGTLEWVGAQLEKGIFLRFKK